MLRNARITTLLLLTQLHLSLSAALPELSSIEPIEFDEAAQRLVARGDAQLEYEGTRVRADRITYYQEYALADAIGSVEISRDGYRILADRMSFDVSNNVFSLNLFRSGQWPYYITAVNAGGSAESGRMEGATIYMGDPGPFTPNITADSVSFENLDDSYVELDNVKLRIGEIPFFYLPGYTHYINNPPYYFNANGGYNSFLGAYLQTTTLFPLNKNIRLGANLDYYTERGALVGPAAQYTYNSETQTMVGAFTSGYIQDQGNTDIDILLAPIDQERGFIEWRHKHHIGDRTTLTANVNYWTDSEVTRDFREDQFDENQRPDTFLEGVYAGDNYIVSAFGRFGLNDFQLIQERLPEVRYDLLPVPVFETGIYQQASLSYVNLYEDFGRVEPAISQDSMSDRLDFNYRIQRPFLLTDWLTFTPLAGARITHYANQQQDPAIAPLNSSSFTREIYELGFDLEGSLYSVYETRNRTWEIDGLRHQVRPVLNYRYFSDPDAINEIAEIDREAFDLNRSILDLSDLRNVDSISETHLTRLGVENLFETRAAGYGSRTLAELNFYQDILFEKGTRYDGSNEDTLNATWVELLLSPAPWLKFNMATRFRTEDLSLEEIRTRTSIRSGEIWEIGFASDLLKDQVNQYRIDFIYRFNERYAMLTDVNFDVENGDITRTSLGLRTRIGNVWEVVYALTFNDANRRESEVEFSIRLRLAAAQ